MARQVNAFALLDDDEGEDLSVLLANVAAKVSSPPPVENKTNKSQPVPDSAPAQVASDSVRVDRGRGRGGRGVGSGRNDDDNGRVNGYQRKNYDGDSDRNAGGENWRGRRGRGRVGGGRGRGFNEDRGFGNESDQVHGGNENLGQSGDDDGWKSVSGGRGPRTDSRQFRNENRNGGGEGRGRYYGGGRGGMRRGRGSGEGQDEFEKREHSGEKRENSDEKRDDSVVEKEQDGNHGNENAVGWGDCDVPVTIEVVKDVEPEQGKTEEVALQVTAEKKKVEEEEEKVMTLVEYEKVMLEKRKALEALKTEERKVALDKDFEAMQLVEKKKEDELFIKLKSEKEKLKKKESLEKEEKVRKSMNINEFLKPAEGERRGRGGRGSRGGRGERGGGGREGRGGRGETAPTPSIGDPGGEMERRGKWEIDTYWTQNQVVQFYAVIPRVPQPQLKFPEKFVQHLKEELLENVVLKGPSGHTWKLGLMRNGDDVFLRNGWEEFVKDHNLKEGEVLLFRYHGHSRFDVFMFDQSNYCEKESSYFVREGFSEEGNCKQETNEMEASLEIVPSREASARYKKKKKLQKVEPDVEIQQLPPTVEPTQTVPIIPIVLSSEEDSSEEKENEELNPVYRLHYVSRRRPVTEAEKSEAYELAVREGASCKMEHFLIAMKKSHVSSAFLLTIPAEAVRRYFPHNNAVVDLRFQGETWPVKYYYSMKQNSAFRGPGWEDFVLKNNLEVGDVCLFELCSAKEVNTVSMNVRIFRVVKEVVPLRKVATGGKKRIQRML